MSIATASFQPRGPWSLPRAAEVLEHWQPVRRFASQVSSSITVGFLTDGAFRPVAVRLRQSKAEGPVQIEVAGVESHFESNSQVRAVIAQAIRMFCLDVDGTDYPLLATRDPALAPVMLALPGLRPVLFASPYEAAVWAVLSARVSMASAARMQQQLITDWGAVAGEGELTVATLPPPSVLRQVVAGGGVSEVKASRLRAVAAAAERGLLDIDELRQLSQHDACQRLQTIPGIGPFWSLGIYVRACGLPDVFPDEPLAIAALGRLHGLGDQPTPEDIQRLTEKYAPFRSWACFLLRVAAARGLIAGISGREMQIRRASEPRTRLPAISRG